MSYNGTSLLFAWLLVAMLIIILYIIPIIVAYKRQHPNRMAIAILTIFLGWSFIGWVVALVWACTTPSNMQK